MGNNRRVERLKFRSWHRGTREIDLLLGSFADAHLDRFSEDQLTRYEGLLAEGDPDLFDWIWGGVEAPSEHQGDVLDLLRQHRFAP